MKRIVLILFILSITITCNLDKNKPYIEKNITKVSYINNSKKTPQDIEKQKKQLIKGILRLRGNYRHVTYNYAKRLVDEVFEVLAMPQNSWMEAHDLLGLAINESDLRYWIETGTKAQPDCGITQNHTPLFECTLYKRWRLCARLKRSSKLSFIYAMKEMNMIKRTICDRYYPKPLKKRNETNRRFLKRIIRWRLKTYRCLFNTYNQGPRFLWKSCKQRINKKKYTLKKYKQRLYRCWLRDLYWLRSLCFAKGVQLGKKPTMSCRRARSVRWINRVYGIRQIF